MADEIVMIDKVREYMATCPYLGEYAELNVEYLVDKLKAFSVNENAGYEPILNKFLCGSERQFLFTLDSKLRWNEYRQAL